MNVTWASVVWLIWAGTIFVAVSGTVLATVRWRTPGMPTGGILLLGSLLMFGFASAIEGAYELSDYSRAGGFWLALLAGFVGTALFGFNLRRMSRRQM